METDYVRSSSEANCQAVVDVPSYMTLARHCNYICTNCMEPFGTCLRFINTLEAGIELKIRVNGRRAHLFLHSMPDQGDVNGQRASICREDEIYSAKSL